MFATTFKQWPSVLLTHLIIPLLLSFFLAFSMQDLFQAQIDYDPVEIAINNYDEGKWGQELVSFLETEEAQDVVTVTEKEEAEFLLIIESGYSDHLQDARLQVQPKANASNTNQTILTSLLKEWHRGIIEHMYLSQKLQQNPEAKEVFTHASIPMEKLASVDIQTKSFDSPSALTSSQFFAVGGALYVLVLFTASSFDQQTVEKFRGLRKRQAIAPLSAKQKVSYNIIFNFFFLLLILGFYWVIWHFISSDVLRGNLLFYFTWYAVLSIFTVSIIELLNTIVPKKLLVVLNQILVILVLLLGMLPLEEFLGERISQIFQSNPIRQIFQTPIYNYMQDGTVGENIPLLALLILSSIILMISTITIKHRKEFT